MRRLQQVLQDFDSGHLRLIAELWGLEAPSGPPPRASAELAREMLTAEHAHEAMESLRAAAHGAVRALAEAGGAMPLADLERRYGAIRPMGPGKRDREKPWRAPTSPLEDLWYRGLLGRAFSETPLGPQEFAFLPSDLMPFLDSPPRAAGPLGAPAPTPSRRTRAGFAIVEDAATILAALRRRPGKSPLGAPLDRFLVLPEAGPLLIHLLGRLRCVKQRPLQIEPEGTRRFLESPPGSARGALFRAWRTSTTWNDLAQVRDLQPPKAGWPNDPVTGRGAILEFLRSIPRGIWWDFGAFVASIRETHPGFQRPGGDFDAWYLRDRATGSFLQGFENWPRVEGALLRYTLTEPLHWLDALELGSGQSRAFRLTESGQGLDDPQEEAHESPSYAHATVQPDGTVTFPADGNRAQRYQVARVTTWLGREARSYTFGVTPSSLRLASKQGLRPAQVREILEAASGAKLPAPLAQAIDRWRRKGDEAAAEKALLLRVKEPSTLEELRRGRATARYLGERLSPRAARVREADWERLRSAAARMGILLDPPEAGGPP